MVAELEPRAPTTGSMFLRSSSNICVSGTGIRSSSKRGTFNWTVSSAGTSNLLPYAHTSSALDWIPRPSAGSAESISSNDGGRDVGGAAPQHEELQQTVLGNHHYRPRSGCRWGVLSGYASGDVSRRFEWAPMNAAVNVLAVIPIVGMGAMPYVLRPEPAHRSYWQTYITAVVSSVAVGLVVFGLTALRGQAVAAGAIGEAAAAVAGSLCYCLVGVRQRESIPVGLASLLLGTETLLIGTYFTPQAGLLRALGDTVGLGLAVLGVALVRNGSRSPVDRRRRG